MREVIGERLQGIQIADREFVFQIELVNGDELGLKIIAIDFQLEIGHLNLEFEQESVVGGRSFEMLDRNDGFLVSIHSHVRLLMAVREQIKKEPLSAVRLFVTRVPVKKDDLL